MLTDVVKSCQTNCFDPATESRPQDLTLAAHWKLLSCLCICIHNKVRKNLDEHKYCVRSEMLNVYVLKHCIAIVIIVEPKILNSG